MKISFIILCFILFLVSCTPKGEDCLYFLPENYKGCVMIIYDHPNGEPRKYLERKRVYEIPATGILKTQFSADHNWTNFPLFYYVSGVKKEEIPILIDEKKTKKDQIYASMPSTEQLCNDLKCSSEIEYSTFYVGTYSEIENNISYGSFKEQVRALIEN